MPTIIGVSFFRPTSVWVLIDVNCDKTPRCGILQCRSAAALKAGPDRCAGVGEVEPDGLILPSKPRFFSRQRLCIKRGQLLIQE